MTVKTTPPLLPSPSSTWTCEFPGVVATMKRLALALDGIARGDARALLHLRSQGSLYVRTVTAIADLMEHPDDPPAVSPQEFAALKERVAELERMVGEMWPNRMRE